MGELPQTLSPPSHNGLTFFEALSQKKSFTPRFCQVFSHCHKESNQHRDKWQSFSWKANSLLAAETGSGQGNKDRALVI